MKFTTEDATEEVHNVVIPATGHTWDEGVVTKEPTHIAEGVKTYTCICGETRTEAIARTESHEWDAGVVTLEPTHVSTGIMTYTCICGETKTEVLAKTEAHEWGAGVVTKEATHIAEGVKTYTCICGETKSETIAKTPDHEWGEGVVTLEPTVDAEGEKTYTCICGEQKTEAIEKLPAPTEDTTITVGKVSADAGDEIVVPVSISNNVGLTGLEIFISYDSDVLELKQGDSGEALAGLTFTNPGDITANPIKFLWDGIEADESNGCILLLKFKVADAAKIGDYAIDVTVRMACDNDVNEVEVATVNGKVSVVTEKPEEHKHEWDEGVITTPATCEEDGIKTFTCACGETKTEVIPATGHEYGEWQKDDALNHKKVCVCGDVVTEAHNWNSGVVTQEPTTEAEGVKTYTCTVCSETKTEAIAKLDPPTGGGGGGGGGSSSTAEKTYTVKFNSNGGSTVEKVTVKKNETVAEPTAPTRVGYTFEGWYTDSKLTKEYNFETPVTKSFALYAKWTEVPKGDEPIVEDPVIEDPTIIGEFTDVMENDWFASSVDFVVENKLMAGVSGGKFAPDVTLTRAMLVTVLYRLEGEPATNRSIPFADVDMGAYYANAVSWAKQNGIVAGISENEFAPDLNITREQIASIMFRYAKFKGYDVSASADITSYNDAGKVSDWATESMKYAVGSGLIMGKTETTLNPLDNATRAEFAAIMQRFVTKNK